MAMSLVIGYRQGFEAFVLLFSKKEQVRQKILLKAKTLDRRRNQGDELLRGAYRTTVLVDAGMHSVTFH